MTTPKMHVKKGDNVEVIAGKDKGKQGKILKVYPKESRVVVEGVNIVQRHTRPSQQFPQGGIIENEAPVHVSNVQLVCPGCKEPSRTGKKVLDDGTKVRYCKNCDKVVDK